MEPVDHISFSFITNQDERHNNGASSGMHRKINVTNIESVAHMVSATQTLHQFASACGGFSPRIFRHGV
ncbi:hypothetical protein OIU77_009517 [Salix suchowensis]|uniref:Uncharacterized protein n=1 Tax=Salix suchowensis TaxID=1278906 RepID=A0ABQ9AEJ4_9ROSI|nr:hypothetical protein OIU77_009517 [Salix suchowensis]